nr:retrovirus-related Pol polyprotein from transposon TNT 1-94 [Tanacetum cinerariifolium]
METYKTVSQDIRDQLNAKAKAVQIILTGIDNDTQQLMLVRMHYGESLESYYSKFYKMMNELIRNQCDVTNHQVNVQSQQAATRNRGKAIVNSPQPIYDQAPSMVAKDDETSKENEIDKLMALISLSSVGYENQRIGNVAGAKETVGSTVVQKYGIQCYNYKEFGHVARECQKPKKTKDAAYHREKMLLYAADSGPIFDADHCKREKIDKNDDDNDLANERELLASLIEKLKCEIDESKNCNNFLETSNKVLVEKLKGEIKDFKNKNKSLESSNNRFKEANNKLSETNNLLYTDFKKSEAELARRNSMEYASKMEIECAQKEAQIMLYKTREEKELDEVIALENKVKVSDNIVYKTGCYNDNLALMLAPESDEVIRLEKESRSNLSDLVRPFDYDKLNNLYDLFVPQREKSSEERYFLERSRLSHTYVNNGNSKESFNKQTTLLKKRMDESIPWDKKCKSSIENFKVKTYVDTVFNGVELYKEKIARRTYSGYLDPFIQNTIEAKFSPEISRINAGLEQFHKCLNEEMVADLRYFNSLELEVDSLISQLETHKTHVYTELDEVSNLQCDYLELLEKCKCLENELSKSKMMSKCFEALQKHAINLEIDLQQCQEKIKNDKSFKENLSKEFCKEREQYFEIQDFKAQLHKGIVISELKKLIEKLKGKYVDTKFEKSLVIRQPNAFKSQRPSVLGKSTTLSNSFERKDFSKSKSVTQNNMANDFSKPVTAQSLPPNKKVILKTSVSIPQLKSNPMGDKVMRNNSQGKKQEVEYQCRNVKLYKNKTSVTACNDSLNDKTLNVNIVSTMCDKCVLNDNHDICVLNSVAKPLKKIVASESNQKPKNITRKLYENVSKTCCWWYPKFTPSGYKCKPKSGQENINPNLVEIVLFIVDSGCSKHMTGNLKLLINFKEKFLGTVKFGNDQIAPILGYGDLGYGSSSVSFELRHINLLSKNDIVVGLPKLKFIKDHLCSSCELGKAKRKSFHIKITPSLKRRLQLLHIDLCGPMREASINGKRYILVIVDDYSRYTWTHFLRSKDETPEVLIDFLRLVQRRLQAQVRIVRTDKGTEFLNQTLHAYFAAEGVLHQTSVARTPEQNDAVERRNRTIVEAARTMLSAAKVLLFFWAEAIATTCFTQNRSLVIPRHEKTSYHIINDRKPLVKFFHIFGSLCYIVRDGENLDKMKEKEHRLPTAPDETIK